MTLPPAWVDRVISRVPGTPVHLYAHPRQETDLRAFLEAVTGEAHGYLSPLVPPGEIRVSPDPIEDDRAVELVL